MNDAGAFSGNTSGSGSEDAGSLTGTLTFTDAIDGDTSLTFTVSSDASNGTASIDASTGAWTYAPNEHFNGSDSFTVTVTDDDGHEETQVITLTLSPLNDAGSFSGDTSGTGAEDSSLTGILTFTDATDGASTPNYTVTAAASNGTASIDASTGAWTYAPNEHFNGSDSFTVTVTDDDGHTETQVISLTVDPGADLYYADLTGAVLTGATLTGANLNDTDLTGATLTNVKSGGITATGTPPTLPTDWKLING